MSRRFVLAAAFAFIGLVLAAAQPAAQSPFTPGSKPTASQVEPAGAAGDASPWTKAKAAFAGLQRQVNRDLAQQVAELNRGTWTALFMAALLSFLYGVFHAAGPGHGKVVVLSYFLGTDARPWRGALMGAQIGLVHVAGALVLAAVAQLAMAGMAVQSVEDLRPVKLFSYAAVAAIGAWLLADRLRRKDADDCGPDHGHGKRGGLVSFVAGMVPCTGALLVVLYCFANGILHYGLIFVLLIGLGMAVTLTGFGLVGMFARRRALALAERGRGPARLRRAMDLGGPALIVAIGALLFVGTY